MNDRPEPGSPEYEAMMAERFRQQRDAASTPLGTPEYRQVPGTNVSIRASSTTGPAHAKEHYTDEDDDPIQVAKIEAEIERVREELEAHGFDQRTGEPIFKVVGTQRRNHELRLAQLERELSYAQEKLRRVQEWRAANVPSAEAQLAADAERQAAIQQRAEAIADEREAQAKAERVITRRRANRGSV